MGKQRDLNIEEKTKALAWNIDRVSTKVIGQRLGWSQHSIQRLFLMGKTYRRLIAGWGLYFCYQPIVGSPLPLPITETVSSRKCGRTISNGCDQVFCHQFFARGAPWTRISLI
jgi:hypothetical protein